jgi:DNA-binding transcriptional MerR regulator
LDYSIKDLERLSGIKAHSIRIWEKRYNLFSPNRSQTNIRSYSEEDLKKMLNVAHLNREGIKISKIAKMSPTMVQQEVLKLQKGSRDVETFIERMIVSVIDLDETNFNKVLSDILYDYDFEILVIDFLFPFLERIGVLWQTGSITPAQEHFISNVIRNKIIVATDRLPIPNSYKPYKFLLFLREGELHEFGLLFSNYLLRKYGFRTIYLGQTVPFKDLIDVQQTYKADFLITSLVNGNTSPALNDYVSDLVDNLTVGRLVLTGQLTGVTEIDEDDVTAITKYRDLIRFIKALQ